MRRLHINGKFYAGGLNGVHRVADRLIRELDTGFAALSPDERPDVTLYIPVRRQWSPEVSAIRVVEEPRGHSQLWEQFILPSRAKGGLLVNLCNLAPVFHPDKLLMLHDAQFLFPDSSYPARLRWGYRLLTPMMAGTSRQVLTVSEYSRQMLDLLGVADRRKTRVLHNGVDHMLDAVADRAANARLGLTDGGYALHFASHKGYKNTAVVLDAFRDPALSDMPLVLLGASPESLVEAGLILPTNAVFAGRVTDGELRALYETALCLLFPSRTEGFGLPPMEGGILGCPSVVSPAGAIPEVCRDAVLYASVDNSDEWRDAVLSYANDDTLRRVKIDLIGRQAAALTWGRAGRQLIATLLDALRA